MSVLPSGFFSQRIVMLDSFIKYSLSDFINLVLENQLGYCSEIKIGLSLCCFNTMADFY